MAAETVQKSATMTGMAHALGRRRDEPERSNASVQSARARAEPPRAILPPPADPTPPLHPLPTEQRERLPQPLRLRELSLGFIRNCMAGFLAPPCLPHSALRGPPTAAQVLPTHGTTAPSPFRSRMTNTPPFHPAIAATTGTGLGKTTCAGCSSLGGKPNGATRHCARSCNCAPRMPPTVP